jgi:hypothetical protein
MRNIKFSLISVINFYYVINKLIILVSNLTINFYYINNKLVILVPDLH